MKNVKRIHTNVKRVADCLRILIGTSITWKPTEMTRSPVQRVELSSHSFLSLSRHILSGCKPCKTEDIDTRCRWPKERSAHVVVSGTLLNKKSGDQKGPLKNNIRTHSGKMSYGCDQCNKVFTSKASLTDHLRTHSGERPFECDQCSKVFSRKFSLTVHQGTHSEEKPYQCDQCDKAFKRKSVLTRHLKTHSEEVPYQCDQCDRSFKAHSGLIYHLRIHSGEKPYTCEQCGKAFTGSKNLIDHIRTHSGEKPYQCDQCGKAFGRKGHLTAHQTIHSEEITRAFKQCTSLAQKSSLDQLLKTYNCSKPSRRSKSARKTSVHVQCGQTDSCEVRNNHVVSDGKGRDESADGGNSNCTR